MAERKNGRLTDYNLPFIEQRADPYIYRHTDGKYYFTASVPSYDRIILRQADTLEGLKDAAEYTIWEKHKKGNMSKHIWAPELHFLDGTWYVYFAGSRINSIWLSSRRKRKKHRFSK